MTVGAVLGVISDARNRQRRWRLIGAAVALLVAAALGAVLASLGGGQHRAPGQRSDAAHSGTVLQGGNLVLYGHKDFTWAVHAPARFAYDVRFTAAPAASRAVVTMQIAGGSGWSFSTRDHPACRTSAGRTVCLLHFAGGGNPGGTWRADVRNTTASTGTFHLLITFFKPARSATS